MTVHDLKTWPEFYVAVESGEKTFELREDDRGYRVGDFLRLKEYLPEPKRYTGKELVVQVTYLVAGPLFGVEPGHVCMAIKLTHL